MAQGPLSGVLRHVRRLVGGRPAEAATDGPLLEQFVRGRDEAAFAELVGRHGPMVLAVCRRVLRHEQDAEDAFQATFLVLAKKAGSVRRPEALGCWLYEVAYHVALRARAAAARRRQEERRSDVMTQPDPMTEAAARELRAVLDEELHRLPAKYRAPLVLCYLQSRTNEEAARQLGWTKGTVSGRLARARGLLRGRLARRGLALAPVLFVPALAEGSAAATLPAALAGATTRAAVRFAAAKTAAAAVASAPVAALTEGVLKTMFWTKLKAVTILALVLGLAGTGAGVLTHRVLLARQPGLREGAGAARVAKAPTPRPKAPPGAELVEAPVRQALEAARGVEDPNLRCLALQEVAKTQARAGDRDSAAQTLQEAVKAARLITGDSRAHSIFWVGLVQLECGDRPGARKTFEEGVAAANAIKDTDARINALNNIAFRLAEANDRPAAQKAFLLALEAARSVPDATDREFRISWVASRQAWAGMVKEAFQTLDAITDPNAQRQVYRDIAVAQARAGDVKAALETVQRIPGPDNIRNNMASMALQDIAEAQARAGDVKGALATAEMISEDYAKAHAFAAIAAARGKKERPKDRTIEKALAAAKAMEPGLARDGRLHQIAASQVKAGDLDGALQVADTIRDHGYKALALGTIAAGQARAKNAKAARQTITRALQALSHVPNEPDKDEWRTVDPQNQWGTRIEIVNALLELGDIKAALEVLRPFKQTQAQALLYRRIAQAQAESGKDKETRQWAANLKSPYARSYALVGMANGILKRAQADKRKAEKK
jgi:RNA polymerase sigma factor (sigma-70 family)